MEMTHSHNLFLVALSYTISVFGSYVGLQLVRGMRSSPADSRYKWVVPAALALGGGAIWAMHFIGMLAYETALEVVYVPGLTFVSLLIAIVVVGAGIFFLSTNRQSLIHLLIAGVLTGLGVASMHYTGMEAMVMAADMTYNPTLVGVSVIIAIIAATAALWLAFNLDGNMQMIGASFIMGLAVCGMHYTGMAAMTMTANHNHVAVESAIAPMTLGLLIFCFSMLLLVLCLIATLIQLNRHMYAQLEMYDAEDDDEPAALKSTAL